MAGTALQKTYKIEIEIMVRMDEIAPGTRVDPRVDDAFRSLTALQHALIENEPALTRQMLSAAVGQLQEYIDHLAAQDTTPGLERLASSLDEEGAGSFYPDGTDFADFSRPLRVGCLSARLESCKIQEKDCHANAEPDWKPVWADLILASELGRQMAAFGIPAAPPNPGSHKNEAHHPLVLSLNRQVDGVHLDGCCSCGVPLNGLGTDENTAFERFWAGYQKHLETSWLAGRIGENQASIFQ